MTLKIYHFTPLMTNISQSERDLIRATIALNKRLDSRKQYEERSICCNHMNLPQSDSAVSVNCGNSSLEIIIRFVSSENHKIQCNIACDNFKIIQKILEQHNLALDIQIIVLVDDGGILRMIYEGLRYMFRNIKVPDLENLRHDSEYTIDLPICKTYAMVDSYNVLDPTKHEELSCDGLIHVFILKEKVVGTEIENATNIDYYALEEVLQHHS